MITDTMFATLVAKPDVANAVAAIGSAALAAVACLLSVISLYVAFRTAKHQEKHDRMSVRPLAYIAVGDYENRLYVRIQNNGIGPLLIKGVTVEGAPDPAKPLIHAMPELPIGAAWTNFVEDISERSVAPGGEVYLVDLEQGSSESQDSFNSARNLIRLELGHLTIRIEHTDVYNQQLPIVARKLDWFHRHNEPARALGAA